MFMHSCELEKDKSYQDREVGVGGLVSRGTGDRIGRFLEGKPHKGITFEM
jgi:cytochrome c-type biogenesis protein CcmE